MNSANSATAKSVQHYQKLGSAFQNTVPAWRRSVRHFEYQRKPDPPVKCIFKLRASRSVLIHGLFERDCSRLLCLGLHSSCFISFACFIHKPSFHSSSHGGSRGEPSGLTPLWMYSWSHNTPPVNQSNNEEFRPFVLVFSSLNCA